MNRVQKTCVEALLMLMVAGVVGVAANSLHPDGLHLNNDYFRLKDLREDKPNAATDSTPPEVSAVPESTDADDKIAPRRRQDEQGLWMINFPIALEYAETLADAEGFIVFLDARDEAAFAEGHIPGAHLLNHYQQDKYLPDLLPLLRAAGVIVIYCNGGDCEDSKYLATSLIVDHKIALDSVLVYEGGAEEWKKMNEPMTEGDEP